MKCKRSYRRTATTLHNASLHWTSTLSCFCVYPWRLFFLLHLQVFVVIKEVVLEQQRKKFHPVSSSQAISEAIWSVLKLSAVMDGGQAANHSHTTEWMKVMCRHMFNKVSKAAPQLRGLEITVWVFLPCRDWRGSWFSNWQWPEGCRASWMCRAVCTLWGAR